MSAAFYNEIDPHAAAWTQGLIDAGLVSPGVVDERSIADVPGDAVRPYRRCHFFAGIGGWEYALRIAGWPADRPVWTGSCPCQPYSSAGKGGGDDDPRNLWPEFRRLIAECRPSTVLGEQVASKAGRLWFDGVRADLEALGYAVGAADLCAAGVGAPHIRQRLYWVADARLPECGRGGQSPREQRELVHASNRCEPFGVADAESDRAARDLCHREGETGSVESRHEGRGAAVERLHGSVGDRPHCGLGDASRPGLEERPGQSGHDGAERPAAQRAGRDAGFWSDFDVIPCRDGKARRVESGTFPLAHGVPGRVGLLRGYGNAIVPQVAAEFVKAFMECVPGRKGGVS